MSKIHVALGITLNSLFVLVDQMQPQVESFVVAASLQRDQVVNELAEGDVGSKCLEEPKSDSVQIEQLLVIEVVLPCDDLLLGKHNSRVHVLHHSHVLLLVDATRVAVNSIVVLVDEDRS